MLEYQRTLTAWDIILPPFYLLVILLIAFFYRQTMIRKHPEYKFFVTGLSLKILGGIGLGLIYLFYYNGGDTTEYFNSCKIMVNIAKADFGRFISILSGNHSEYNAQIFSPTIGYSCYWRDPPSFSVVRFTTPFVILGGQSYFTTTILVASFTYLGIWRLFQFLYNRFPDVRRGITFAVLYIPSAVFWGSGILKDSYTLMAACLLLVSFYRVFVDRVKIASNIFWIIVSFYILVSLKPYIFFAVTGAFIFAMSHQYIKDIKNKVVKVIVIPLLFIVIVIGGLQMMLAIGESVGGQYASLDRMLEKASGTQLDLKQDYYGGNSFDIGSFEPTIPGVLSKFPAATLAGLYRPYLWDSRNPVMLISAIENTVYLLLTLYLLLLSFVTWRKHGLNYLGKVLFNDSFLIFCLLFSILFAFFVGLSTANFGALVRYKIPLIPFFLSMLFILVNNFNKEKTAGMKKS